MMTRLPSRLGVLCLAPFLAMLAATTAPPVPDAPPHDAITDQTTEKAMNHEALTIQYLEIVTPALDETCAILAKTHGVVFSDPIPELGNARTADLADGGRIGVRAPMRETEQPVVRPYILVDDIQAAAKAAEAAGGTIAIPPMPIPGQGTFAIYILGGIEHGLWQR